MISNEGPIAIVWLHVIINAEEYLSEILENYVKNLDYLTKDGIFQQDNAPAHRAPSQDSYRLVF